MFHCPNCRVAFRSDRALTTHCHHSKKCYDAFYQSFLNPNNATFNQNAYDENNHNHQAYDDSNLSFEIESNNDEIATTKKHSYLNNENIEMAILNRFNEYKASGISSSMLPANAYKSLIDLLHILKQSNSPLYLFDEIVEWAQRSCFEYTFDFNASNCLNRNQLLSQLKTQFDFNYIEPSIYNFLLPGSNNTVEIVTHDFLSSVYTLLNDESLMQSSNLLIYPQDPYKEPDRITSSSEINDVNTGEVWRIAYNRYCKRENREILCPIIFLWIKHTPTEMLDYALNKLDSH